MERNSLAVNSAERGHPVITRKSGEATVIVLEDGRTIRVVVSVARPSHLKLYWDAPRSVRILREELLAGGLRDTPATEATSDVVGSSQARQVA